MAIAAAVCVLLAPLAPRALWPLTVLAPLLALGVWDVLQTRHSVLRNHPILGHLRFLLQDLGPEMHQYVVENNTDGRPYGNRRGQRGGCGV